MKLPNPYTTITMDSIHGFLRYEAMYLQGIPREALLASESLAGDHHGTHSVLISSSVKSDAQHLGESPVTKLARMGHCTNHWNSGQVTISCKSHWAK